MTPQDSTPATDPDGCVGEHQPGSNPNCVMAPAAEPQPEPELGFRRFDPVAAAQDAPAGESPLSTVVGQFGGYLSSCWDNLEGAGVFESERAADAVEQLVRWLEQRGVTGPPAGDTHHHHEGSKPQMPAVAEFEFERGDRLLLVKPDVDDVTPEAMREVVAQVEAALDDRERRVGVLAGMSVVVLKGQPPS